jgi:hypothetical protein
MNSAGPQFGPRPRYAGMAHADGTPARALVAVTAPMAVVVARLPVAHHWSPPRRGLRHDDEGTEGVASGKVRRTGSRRWCGVTVRWRRRVRVARSRRWWSLPEVGGGR